VPIYSQEVSKQSYINAHQVLIDGNESLNASLSIVYDVINRCEAF
jgi:hypothetical protein